MTKPAIPIDRLWVLRPPYFFLAILLVGLMACQTEEVAVTPARSAQLTATPSANQLSPENITHLQPLARWGEGKAVAAQVAESRNWLAVATTIGVYVYQADTLQPIWFEPTAVTVEAVGFGANGRYLYALTHNRQTVQIWHSDSQTLAATIDSDVAIQEVIFLPDEQSVLVGTAAAVSRWQISPTPAQLFTITAANEQFGALSLMGADEFLSLATQAEGSHIQRRQLADGALVSRLAAPTALTLQAVKVSPDGRTIAATGSPGA